MNKKGSILDAAYLLGGLMLFAIIAVVGVILVNNLAAAFTNIGDYAAAQQIINTLANNYPPMMDFWFVCLFVGAPLVAAVLAYFNNIHPFFFWISLLFTLFLVVFGKALQLAWTSLMSDATLEAAASAMPMMNAIMSNYGFYSFLVVILISIGTFIKIGGVRSDVIGGI
jgi:hypothetical protein